MAANDEAKLLTALQEIADAPAGAADYMRSRAKEALAYHDSKMDSVQRPGRRGEALRKVE